MKEERAAEEGLRPREEENANVSVVIVSGGGIR